MSLGLALGAALAYGTGDFLGGFASRRTALLSVLLISQGVGLIGMLVVAAITGGSPHAGDLAAGAVAGIAGGAGVAMLYRGLASGTMSLVAPITGVVAVGVPVVFGLATGERPAALQYAGIATAVAAVALLSGGGPSAMRLSRPSLLLALGAGFAIGVFYVAFARAAPGAGLWPVVSARGASVFAFAVASLVLRARPGLGGTSWWIVVLAGLLDVAANALYLLALHGGLLSIVAVLVSLYPVVTVACSVVALRERLHAGQVAGVAAALAAVVLITA